ncbi:hypothetical protein DMENIID0001_046150 [Sergentomyia squamirostris]
MSSSSSPEKSSRGRVKSSKSVPKSRKGHDAPSVATFRNFEREAELMSSNGGGPPGKRVCLSDLFRPPVEVLHRGTWESGREVARTSNKWLLVNLQDNGDFKCQCLNRDIWADDAIREILQRYFIMCQVSHTSEDGEKFRAFYRATSLPFVGVIDPRTGGAADTWPTDITRDDAQERLLKFLRRHPTPTDDEAELPADLGAEVDPPEIPSHETDALSEEEQLRIAIENSLRETQASSASSSAPPSPCAADEEEPKEEPTHISLRLPDDTTELITLPASATVERLSRHVRQRHAATSGLCKLIFPATRTDILTLKSSLTLREAKLHPRAVLYLHYDDA